MKNPASMMGSGTRPGGYPVTFFCTGVKAPVSPASKDSAASSSSHSGGAKKSDTKVEIKSEEEEKDVVFEMDDTLRHAIRDAKLKYLTGIGEKDVPREVLSMNFSKHPFYLAYTNMVSEYPAHVPLRLAGLNYTMKCATCCETNGISARKQQYLDAVVMLADEIFGMIDKVAIMTELGVLIDMNDTVAVKRRKDIKDIREQVSNFVALLPWHFNVFVYFADLDHILNAFS
jgi:hypothetical protein